MFFGAVRKTDHLKKEMPEPKEKPLKLANHCVVCHWVNQSANTHVNVSGKPHHWSSVLCFLNIRFQFHLFRVELRTSLSAVPAGAAFTVPAEDRLKLGSFPVVE